MSDVPAPRGAAPTPSASVVPSTEPAAQGAPQLPSYTRSIPLLIAALGLLMVFLVVAWLLFVPSTFGQRLVAFGVAAGLMVYLVNVIDGAQRRSIDRLRLRMVMERDLAVARALADEREQVLKEFLGAFVVKVHGSAGDMVPYGSPLAINVGGQPVEHQAMSDGDGRDHSRGAPGGAPRASAGR